jgi:hypothetical protein
MKHIARTTVLAFAMATAAACGKKDDTTTVQTQTPPPPAPPAASVSTIETGKHLGTNLRVAETTSEFAPKDTLYVAIVTENPTADTKLSVRWSDAAGRMIDSSSRSVAVQPGIVTAVTEFHVVKPSGWAVGKYKVEVWLNNQPVGDKEIEVKR